MTRHRSAYHLADALIQGTYLGPFETPAGIRTIPVLELSRA